VRSTAGSEWRAAGQIFTSPPVHVMTFASAMSRQSCTAGTSAEVTISDHDMHDRLILRPYSVYHQSSRRDVPSHMPKSNHSLTAMDQRDKFTRYEVTRSSSLRWIKEKRERIDTTYLPPTINEGLGRHESPTSMMSELAGIRGSRNWLLIYMDG
jgi:hypothetical protein